MLLSDLLQPMANPQWRPQGGPVIPAMPKAQSNAMATSIGVGAQPKQSTPAEQLNALTGLLTARSNIELTDAQKQEILARLAILKESGQPPPPMYSDAAGTGAKSAPSGALAGTGRPETEPSSISSLSDPRGLVPYIRDRAEQKGIDPDTAVQVASTEGLANPVGDGGKSGGAFQLYTGGGVGNLFQNQTGLDPLDPKNERATIDFALDHAAKNGWRAWNGAKAAGITGFMGIGRPTGRPTQLASAAPSTMTDASDERMTLPNVPSGNLARQPGTLAELDQSLRDKLGLPAAAVNGVAGPGLPNMSPQYTFGRPAAPSNAGQITAPAVPDYGTPPAGQPSGPIPPGYRPPLATAGAEFGGRSLPPLTPVGAPGPAVPLTRDQVNAQLLGQSPASQATPGRQLNPAYIDWALREDRRNSLLGKRNPIQVDEAIKMVPGGAMSPEYKQSITEAEQRGLRTGPGFDPQLQRALEAAKAAGAQPYELERITAKANEEARTAGAIATAREEAAVGPKNQIARNQADLEMITVTMKMPDGSFREVPMTRLQASQLTNAATGGGAQQANPLPAVPSAAGALAPSTTPGVLPNGITLGKPFYTPPETQRSDQLGSEYKDVSANFEHAQKAQVPLTAIELASQDFRTGPSATTRLSVLRSWQDLLQGLNVAPSAELSKWVSSGEIINKSGTTLGFELARTLGSREAQNIVQQAIATNPGLANSPEGNEKLIGVIKQGLQRDTDKKQFYDDWYRSHDHSYDGAANAFNKAAPTEGYISKVIPYRPADEGAYNRLPPGVTYVHPKDGSLRTKSLGSQVQPTQ